MTQILHFCLISLLALLIDLVLFAFFHHFSGFIGDGVKDVYPLAVDFVRGYDKGALILVVSFV